MKKILSFLRWRIVTIRYITMFANIRWLATWRSHVPSLKVSSEILSNGYERIGSIDKSELSRIVEIFKPRIDSVSVNQEGAPFINLLTSDDITTENPILKLAFSKEIFDVASDYFGGNFILDSIQVLYSWPNNGELRESQKWHKDYGDNKSFHAVIYLNDVGTVEDGPFVFINKAESKCIKYSPFVRRIDDDMFNQELEGGEINYFYGRAGEILLVDPAVCYHYGSRGSNSRMALFLTFNTSMPFVKPQELILQNGEKLFDVARQLRPDLSESFLNRVISV